MIEIIPYSKPDRLRKVVDEFHAFVDALEREPLAMGDLSRREFTKGYHLVTKRKEDGTFQGAMDYRLVQYDSMDAFADRFPHMFGGAMKEDHKGRRVGKVDLSDVLGLRQYSPGDTFANMIGLEAFDSGQGIGTELVQLLKDQQEVKGIVLHSQWGAEDFYKKVGFRRTGFHIDSPIEPVVVWMRHDKY